MNRLSSNYPRSVIRSGVAVVGLSWMGYLEAGMIDKDGMQPWEICALCHSADGISPMSKFPKLAGQKADYIKTQFIAFREGDRRNDGGQMQAITTEVELDSIDQIANYFADLPAPSANDELSEDASRQQGKNLFTKGRGDVPACVSCHGDENSSAPWIDAQHASYIQKQLVDFKNTERLSAYVESIDHAQGSVISMQTIAAKLTEDEINSVGIYLESISLERN